MKTMMKMMLVALVVLSPLMAMALPSNQVLVQTTATRVDTAGMAVRKGIIIQNNGLNSIYCRVSSPTSLAVGYGYKLDPGGVLNLLLPGHIPVYCLAATANQVAGSATDVTEF